LGQETTVVGKERQKNAEERKSVHKIWGRRIKRKDVNARRAPVEVGLKTNSKNIGKITDRTACSGMLTLPPQSLSS
jgi:hypothetical protein